MPAARDRRRSRSRTIARTTGVLHRDRREPRHVARARHVAGRVEAVGAHEVRVAQAELRAPSRSSSRRSAACRRARRSRRARRRRRSRSGSARASTRSRTVSRSPAREVDRRLADRARRRGSTVTTSVELRVLERDEHRHQLRDARDRQLLVGRVRAREHLAGGAVLDEVGARVDARTGGGGRRCDARARRTRAGGDSRGRTVPQRGTSSSTRIFWPTLSEVGVRRSGFSCSSALDRRRRGRARCAERVAGTDRVVLRVGRRAVVVELASAPVLRSSSRRVAVRASCGSAGVVPPSLERGAECTSTTRRRDRDEERRGRGVAREVAAAAPARPPTSRRRPRPRARGARPRRPRPRASRRARRAVGVDDRARRGRRARSPARS